MESRERADGSYPELLPEDFAERLERLAELAGVSWVEFAKLVGVESDRVTGWRTGTIPTGGEVWHIMRLALSIPGGKDVMLSKATGLNEDGEHPE